MSHGDVETYHAQGAWKNRVEGQSGDIGTYDSRDEAIAEGRKPAMGRKVEHIHPTDGRHDRRAEQLRPRSEDHPRLTGVTSLYHC